MSRAWRAIIQVSGCVILAQLFWKIYYNNLQLPLILSPWEREQDFWEEAVIALSIGNIIEIAALLLVLRYIRLIRSGLHGIWLLTIIGPGLISIPQFQDFAVESGILISFLYLLFVFGPFIVASIAGWVNRKHFIPDGQAKGFLVSEPSTPPSSSTVEGQV